MSVPPDNQPMNRVLIAGAFVLALAVTALVPARARAQNRIVTENQLPGTPSWVWDISGIGDPDLQGFATDISYAPGDTARFKIKTDASEYTVDIYRLGYYQGNGARLIGSATVTATLPQSQPYDLFDPATGLVDCGNWAESAEWTVPADAVSGIYIARLHRPDSRASHIPFIVRDDSSHSDLLFQTSDATWHAYNSYGGNTFYVGATSYPNGHATKVSYNRPMYLRAGGGGTAFVGDGLFNAEYPMLRWLEANGYDVSYTTNVDSDRRGELIRRHRAFLSVGHDEYWSAAQRAHVTAARDAGVHLAFFSGNEVYWKTRWETSTDSSATPYRTLVCYKEGTQGENVCGGKCDPLAGVWTGLWRAGCDLEPAEDACAPENTLSGQISWKVSSGALKVPGRFRDLRFWRNTAVASMDVNGIATLTDNAIGYEWDFEQYPDTYPPGRIVMSETFLDGVTHHLSLYRHPGGALVFGAGTVQWSWGLDGVHERGGSTVSPEMRQATVNLLADMGVQPGSLQPDLQPATQSTDVTPPASTITFPAMDDSVSLGATISILGTATDSGGVVAGVEVSVDGGQTWRRAYGGANWSYVWTPNALGPVTIASRSVDDSGLLEATGSPPATNAVSVTVVTPPPPNCPCTIFPPDAPPVGSTGNDGFGVELGVRFRPYVDGYVTGVRFWKDAMDLGVHTAHLWSSNGDLLAEATFTSETQSGWQEVVFPTAVPVAQGNGHYVASYHSSAGWYSTTLSHFVNATVNPPLRALADGEDGANGLYSYTETGAFPTQSYLASNYWVDVVFHTTAMVDAPGPVGRTLGYALHGGAPNPFTRSTVLAFDIPRAEAVRIEVFDITGRRVRTLVSGRWEAGRHHVVWDGRDERGARLAGGVYIHRMTAGTFSGTRHSVLLP
jgi:hypothetical protein